MTPTAHTLTIMIDELEDNNYEAGKAIARNASSQMAARTKARESRKRLFDFLKLMSEEDLKSL